MMHLRAQQGLAPLRRVAGFLTYSSGLLKSPRSKHPSLFQGACRVAVAAARRGRYTGDIGHYEDCEALCPVLSLGRNGLTPSDRLLLTG